MVQTKNYLMILKMALRGLSMFKKTLVCRAVVLAIAVRKLNEGGNIA